ncbi:MAG: putative ABC transporter ATP-binding protein YbhF [Alphaproteobacteria bacterium MarineAlpha5_Bin7]|nr:MAG: putative ABC transporter ATP-binding protein YbhF [Alphaproteobacteria bacterium MarineAlpha5_Bin7]|tara:strand:- start:5294 stop:6238 length:945 start_codon:yes stop_codon:yes gene_type:complete
MENFISIQNLSKIYSNKFTALDKIDLNIKKGEIFALLGPNGAGKTTLINIICGIVTPTSGNVLVNEFNIIDDYRKTRSLIGIVPQELTLEAFETVFNNVNYSRGLYGKKPNNKYIESLLKELSLWDKKNNKLRELSGGMKRRVLIAKALSHEPQILFLDEPTASVDVELRIDMWKIIKKLKSNGVTIILTTHYIEEAEEIADRVGIINNGKIILIDQKDKLIKKLGKKKLIIHLESKINKIPNSLMKYKIEIDDSKNKLTFFYDKINNNTSITTLLQKIREENIVIKDINTEESSLEEIFVNIVKGSNDEYSRY